MSESFQERLDTIRAVKEAGLQVCGGGIIGMGETWQDRVDMACLLKELEVDSVPLNILVPIKGTALQSLKPLSCEDIIKAICLFRIILKDKVIKREVTQIRGRDKNGTRVAVDVFSKGDKNSKIEIRYGIGEETAGRELLNQIKKKL